MNTRKLFPRDGRGGRRENAGRKSNWKNKDTITIRIPRAIVFQVIEIAHKIDSGEHIELETESKAEGYNFDIQSKSNKNEITTKSILSYNQAIEIAKQILLSKKSARVSVTKIIS